MPTLPQCTVSETCTGAIDVEEGQHCDRVSADLISQTQTSEEMKLDLMYEPRGTGFLEPPNIIYKYFLGPFARRRLYTT